MAWAFSWGDGRDTYFHPVTWLSLMADLELFGFRPPLLHLENLALHALTALLLFLTARRATGRAWPSLAAALLFGLHPLGVEAVAWITERKTVLATCLAMGAVRAWVAQVERPARWRLALSVLLFALAVLARPQVVVLPGLLLALDAWPLRRVPGLAEAGGPFPQAPPGRLLLEKWPFAAVSLAGAALVLASLPNELATEPPPGLGYRLAQAVASIADYLGAMAWPSRLAILREQPEEVTAGALALGALTLLVGSAAAAWQARRRPWWLFGWLWFLVALAPALGLVQNGVWPAWADRFAYAPLLGVSLAVAFGVAELPARWPALRWPVAGAAAATLLALGLATRAQVGVWQSSEALMRQAVERQPGSALLRAFYAAPLMNAGRFAEARAELEEALRLRPGHALATLRLAEVLRRLGDHAGAAARYREVVARHPNHPDAHLALGRLALEQGWLPEARLHLRRYLELAPVRGGSAYAQAAAMLRQAEGAGR
ncbi:MAG: tetratricopeptide repeat protein [Anaeromyxobacteraceae bacterium]|nr:tetratricopeptide repeat protein [Anaeromyxobacteraceae bacterium]